MYKELANYLTQIDESLKFSGAASIVLAVTVGLASSFFSNLFFSRAVIEHKITLKIDGKTIEFKNVSEEKISKIMNIAGGDKI